MKTCTCGRTMKPNNQTGMCLVCWKARTCIDCGAPLSAKSTGRCRKHANAINNASEKHRKAASASMKRLLANPAEREKRSDAWRADFERRRQDPAFMERLRENGRRHGARNIYASHNPISRAKAGRRISATRLAHIPTEQRALYRELRSKGISAPEAERLVLDDKTVQDARAVAEVRARMGR